MTYHRHNIARNGAACRHVLHLHRTCPDNLLAEGMGWYNDAHAHAVEVAKTAGISTAAGAGIIAALSPRLAWSSNLAGAHELAATGTTTRGLGANRDKAARILAGADPLDVLGGNKVRSFYATILEPDTAETVVVDMHAFDVLAGSVTDDQTRKALERVGVYEAAADVYRRAADIAHVLPHQIQATTWTHWRTIRSTVTAGPAKAAA